MAPPTAPGLLPECPAQQVFLPINARLSQYGASTSVVEGQMSAVLSPAACAARTEK